MKRSPQGRWLLSNMYQNHNKYRRSLFLLQLTLNLKLFDFRFVPEYGILVLSIKKGWAWFYA